MIAYLKGSITYKCPTHIHIECNGVGYHVNISLPTYSYIENKEEVKLHTYMHIREDAHTLYGFYAEEERDMFLNLISISGIGPNTGRLIVSSMSVNELKRAILEEDVSLIQTMKGIGPKSAKRLVLELKDKVGKIETSGTVEESAGVASASLKGEALSALTMLGFQKAKAEKALAKALKENNPSNVEELIKLSLKNL